MTKSSYFGSFIDKTVMQDGATPHYALIVREWLSSKMVDMAHITGLHEVLTSPRVTFYVKMSKGFFKIENMKKEISWKHFIDFLCKYLEMLKYD